MWRNVRHELDRMHLVTLASEHVNITQHCAITPGHKKILTALDSPSRPGSSTSPSQPSLTEPSHRPRQAGEQLV